ncbi:Ubiquitin carboxyl-terminal hydrolase 7 [Puccinia graminis f. sp. tritici]|uniref:Ubiquitin carboxyl-terminal hydrolase 7 n=1 Tax=Puccinia graminis f. sp. tritici TaxID=56615 RepID=A0A5B0QQ29_PUCGR|nr:Ubiquitin carboxyl-terminal hydrolase 7 [Puccinia graminis f. sp. tritici]
MACIGFCGASEAGKTAGVYTWREGITEMEKEYDAQIWSNLQAHNKFICERVKHFSNSAYSNNKKILEEFGVPSWSDTEWNAFNRDSQVIFSNVAITCEDFYNTPHKDPDHNPLTYGLFSYINKHKSLPILPPANIEGHAFRFPQFDCNIDFGTTPGIIEIMWPSNAIDHQTTAPPHPLKTTTNITHFGCSFQISDRLMERARILNKLNEEEIKSRTVSQSDRMKNSK